MARVKRYYEATMGRFPEGTFARIEAVLAPTEDRTDFFRAAVERELKRRERSVAAPLARHLAPPTARERAVRGGKAA
jgi:hypothetical protein